jgi:hypothetical protein
MPVDCPVVKARAGVVVGFEHQAHPAGQVHRELAGAVPLQRVWPSRDESSHGRCCIQIAQASAELAGAVSAQPAFGFGAHLTQFSEFFV